MAEKSEGEIEKDKQAHTKNKLNNFYEAGCTRTTVRKTANYIGDGIL